VRTPASPLNQSNGRPRARRHDRGISLVEVLIATVILAVAIFGHAASVLAAHRLNKTTEDSGIAALTLGRFVERLRADPDWPGLYARLRAISTESTGDTTLSKLGADSSLTCYPATTYYSDFTVPAALGTTRFLVQVPSTTVSGVPALRESASAPRYGLPYDMNGDGAVDANSRNTDYVKLPVVVRIRWSRANGEAREIVLATWLRGER
jgi:Tfp pilus assembly protein PilV